MYTKHVLRECCAAELASWSKFLKFLKTLFHGFSRAKSNSVLQSSGSLLVISCFQKLMISVRKVAVGTLLTGSQVKELTSDQIRSGRQTMSRVVAGKGVEHKLQISKSLWFRKTMRADPIQAARLCFPKPTIPSISRWTRWSYGCYGRSKFLSSVSKGTRGACQIQHATPHGAVFRQCFTCQQQVNQVNMSKKSEDGMKRGREVEQVRRDVQSSDCPK